MDHRGLVRLSKRMSRALRHAPGQFGLTLDHAGWVPVADFLTAFKITRADLEVVVAGNDKQRFAIRRDHNGFEWIRASQGHSIKIDLELVPQSPPRTLYHGTTGSALNSIRALGIHRGRRHHVHLSTEPGTAYRVGARRPGAVVVLTVDADAMARDSYLFYRSANGVWLTDSVPARYLQVDQQVGG